MTARAKTQLGQGLFFGAFFLVLGWLMKFWSEGSSAPSLGGRIAMIAGAALIIWGVAMYYLTTKKGPES